MGISGYFTYLAETYPNTIKLIDENDGTFIVSSITNNVPLQTHIPEPVDHICFDVNNLIYGAARRTNSVSHFMILVYKQINSVLKMYPPTKSVYLALDGPGPRAKLKMQRERRLKGALDEFMATQFKSKNISLDIGGEDDEEKELEDEKVLKHNVSSSSKKKKRIEGLDTLQFTPGTHLMAELKESLCYYVASRLAMKQFQDVKFYVSGADSPGEGELKLFSYISELKPSDGKNCLIVGNDSDLVLFGIKTVDKTVKLLRPIASTNWAILDLEALKNQVTSSLKSLPNFDQKASLSDFIFLSLLNGNDYIPKLRGFNFATAWSEYVALRKSTFQSVRLFDDEKMEFHWDFLLQLLKFIDAENRASVRAKIHPKNLVLEIYQKYLKFLPQPTFETVKEDEAFNVKVITEGIVMGTGQGATIRQATAAAAADMILSDKFKDFVEERAPPILYNYVLSKIAEFTTDDDKLIKPSAPEKYSHSQQLLDYLQGVAWVMRYLTGKCANYNYHYPYAYSPSLPTFLKYRDSTVELKCSEDLPLTPIEFCLAVLPAKGKEYVPKPFQHIMEPGSETYSLYVSPNGSPKAWDMKKIDNILEQIKNAAKKVPQHLLTPEERDRSKFNPDLLFMRSENLKDIGINPRNDFVFVYPRAPRVGSKIYCNPSTVCLTRQQNGKWDYGHTKYSRMTHQKRQFSTTTSNNKMQSGPRPLLSLNSFASCLRLFK